MLNGKQRIQHLFLICKFFQLLKLHRILVKSVSNPFCKPFCKSRITVHKPPAESDTIRLIIELLRINLIKIMKLRIF